MASSLSSTSTNPNTKTATMNSSPIFDTFSLASKMAMPSGPGRFFTSLP